VAAVCGVAPVKLVRSFLAGDTAGVGTVTGVENRHIQTLFEHIIERRQEEEFLGLQSLELPMALGGVPRAR
jgi:hypothetical protein